MNFLDGICHRQLLWECNCSISSFMICWFYRWTMNKWTWRRMDGNIFIWSKLNTDYSDMMDLMPFTCAVCHVSMDSYLYRNNLPLSKQKKHERFRNCHPKIRPINSFILIMKLVKLKFPGLRPILQLARTDARNQ